MRRPASSRVLLHECLMLLRCPSRWLRDGRSRAVLSRVHGHCFDGESASEALTHEVRDGMDTIDAVSHLDEGREEVQFPQPRVEARRLELLDEVAVRVLVPMHHQIDDSARDRKSFLFCQREEVRMEPGAVNTGREEVERGPDLVALVVLVVRGHRQALHLGPQQNLCRRHVGSELFVNPTARNRPRRSRAIIIPVKVVVSQIAQDDAEDALRAMLEPSNRLREHLGHWLPDVAGKRVEANKRQRTHGYDRPSLRSMVMVSITVPDGGWRAPGASPDPVIARCRSWHARRPSAPAQSGRRVFPRPPASTTEREFSADARRVR